MRSGQRSGPGARGRSGSEIAPLRTPGGPVPIFSIGMFFAPEFVTREQFPNSDGQGFNDLVTLRYALASVIFAIAIISFHIRNIEGVKIQKIVMRGYTIAFSAVFFTNLVLHIAGKISAIPPIIGTGFIAILSLITLIKLKKN